MHNNGKIYRPSVPVVLSPSLLPSEYQQVEYLQSDGNSYINSAIPCYVDSFSIGIHCIFQSLTTSSNNPKLFGVSGAGGFFVIISTNIYVYYDNSSIYQNSYDTDVHSLQINVNNDKKLFYDGVEYVTLISESQSNYPVIIFGTNYYGTPTHFITARLFSFKIDLNGTLLRDFYPCYRKLDNVAGLYDIVNDLFFTNQGSGSFVVGPDCTEVLQ